MTFSAKHLFATLSLLTALAVTPSTASAGDSVHISVPGLSIGFHDVHHSDRYYRKKHYRSKNYYYDDRRYERRKYRKSRKRYYNKRRYNNNYYYNDRRYDRGYSNGYRYDNYRSNVCPIDGYSRYYDRDRNCYEHKGHYHCS